MTRPEHDPLAWIDEELAQLDARGLLRQRRAHAGPQAAQLSLLAGSLVNFGSNDYLGLAADPRIREAARRAIDAEGWGAGASPLVTGYAAAHERLEARLAEFMGSERAVEFSSGYAANVGTISALVGRGDAIFTDAKNHASMIDGCRLSRADVHIYPHADAAALEKLLATHGADARRRLIVTESVFSMDGDWAPLVELANLAERFDCMLLVDEAHATGVFGPGGRGLAEELRIEDRIHIRLGTLSKALGSAGGFACGRRSLVEWLVNRARPYVFSTASPPATSAAALAALEIIEREPERRSRLLAHAARVRQTLSDQGWATGASASQIIPLFVGDPRRAMELSAALREQGLLVPGIRPPSVPAGESLLRISLSAAHSEEMIARLLEALARVAPGPARARKAEAARP